MKQHYDIVIVGAGFTGLSAAYELSKKGKKVCLIESEDQVGGLAGSFQFDDGTELEKFYHHWFNSDVHIQNLINELGLKSEVMTLRSRTAMYLNQRIWKLSSPLDLLRFKALSIGDRFRLGLLMLKIRKVKDWKQIEHLSIREWLEPLCGQRVFDLVWEPLIRSKFSEYSETVSAVWMWKKLSLRGNSRNIQGYEELLYFKGGFSKLSKAIVMAIEKSGGRVLLGTKALSASVDEKNTVTHLLTSRGSIAAKQFLFTTSCQIIAQVFHTVGPLSWLSRLSRVKYLGNICLILRLTRSLSETYWLNVNDPGFPFVGVIEHTNLDKPEHYNNSHVVYLSRYASQGDPAWKMTDVEYFNYAMEHVKKMFPNLKSDWVIDHKVWRAEYAQPITEKNYSKHLISNETPYENVLVSTMAQIYPEDRGTNYAVRDGVTAAKKILAQNSL